MAIANAAVSSIWLKPMLKCMDKIINCKKSQKINFQDIKAGTIVNLRCKDSNSNNTQERTYLATTNWDKTIASGSFMSLNGRQIVLSARVLKGLTVFMIGYLKT